MGGMLWVPGFCVVLGSEFLGLSVAGFRVSRVRIQDPGSGCELNPIGAGPPVGIHAVNNPTPKPETLTPIFYAEPPVGIHVVNDPAAHWWDCCSDCRRRSDLQRGIKTQDLIPNPNA